LLAKVQAVDDLCARATPVPVERVTDELRAVLESPLDSYQADRARSMSARLLAMLDGLPQEPVSREDELAAMLHAGWESLVAGDVTEADRLHREWAQETGWHKWDGLWGDE
jgi:hypothetical protein